MTGLDNNPSPYLNSNKVSDSPVLAIENSSNRKIGKCSATYVSQFSCPTYCPLFNNGCYAELGLQGIHTRRINSNSVREPKTLAEIEAEMILTLSGTKPLRLHVVGDSITEEGTVKLAESAAIYKAKHNKPVWTYTHGVSTSREAWGSISVLRSTEDVAGVMRAHEDGFASAMLVSEFEEDKPYDIGEGFTGVPCLHQTGAAEDCASCLLCTKDTLLHEKKRVVLFAAHGSRKSTIKKNLQLKVINNE